MVFTPDYAPRYFSSVKLGILPAAGTSELVWSLSGAIQALVEEV